MPLACNASTWSFINAINGDTTTVKPGRSNAGNWKHSDLPPPVGSSAKTAKCQCEVGLVGCHARQQVLRQRDIVGFVIEQAELGPQHRQIGSLELGRIGVKRGLSHGDGRVAVGVDQRQ